MEAMFIGFGILIGLWIIILVGSRFFGSPP
jgi:hypothetical protein